MPDGNVGGKICMEKKKITGIKANLRDGSNGKMD